ncbi:MAG: hypothetical protein WCA55_01990, partial [Xanthobacteraceae bacterium]
GRNAALCITAILAADWQLWVKSPHYRAAALLSASPPISRPRQNGFNATLRAQPAGFGKFTQRIGPPEGIARR